MSVVNYLSPNCMCAARSVGLLALLSIGVSLSAGGSGGAQSAVSEQADASKLPKVVSLAVRGKLGDNYSYSSHFEIKASVRITKPKEKNARQGSFTTSERKVERCHVGDVSSNGNVALDVQTTLDEQTVIADGQRRDSKGTANTVRKVLASNGHIESITGLDLQNSKAHTKRAHDADAKAETTGLSLPPIGFIFPDRLLHVGDTWRGTIQMGRSQYGTDRISFTAKLEAIEIHRGLPCARVSFTLDLVPALQQKLQIDAPRGNIDDSIAENYGQFTIYYSLDRGMEIDVEADVMATVAYTSPQKTQGSEPPDTTTTLTLSISGNETCDQFPSYDPSLVDAASEVTAQ